MNTTELIKTVSAHLHNIVTQSYTICAVNLTASIVNAGAALGIVICGGAYDPDTNTRVLYAENINR